jgi:hypothetical protein
MATPRKTRVKPARTPETPTMVVTTSLSDTAPEPTRLRFYEPSASGQASWWEVLLGSHSIEPTFPGLQMPAREPGLSLTAIMSECLSGAEETRRMASHRIICDNQAPVSQPKSHAHIVLVGLASTSPGKYSQLLKLAEVLEWIDAGETFYTVSPSTGDIAQVVAVWCEVCGHRIIRSSADAVTDNNLDRLPDCAR